MDAQSLNDDIYAKVNSLRSEAEEALSELESISGMPYLSWFNFAPVPVYEPQRARPIGSDDLPVLERASLPMGHELTADMADGYRAKVWQSAQMDRLQEMILASLETGGTGIDQAVEDAIFNRGREREMQATRDALDLAGARTGARGFRYPTSMTKALQREILVNEQHRQSDLNREIVRLMAELAQRNTENAMRNALAVEQAHMDFARSFAGVVLDIRRGILDAFRVEQEARIAEYEGRLRGVAAGLEVELKNATLEHGYQEQLMKRWEVEAGMVTEQGKAQIAQAQEANRLRMSASTVLVEGLVKLMQNTQANAISVVTKKS